MLSIFPLEIEETILDLLAEDDRGEGHSAMKMCSLVCKAFLPICRKHIFRSTVLNTSLTTHAFKRLLQETPEIADYIRKLNYIIIYTDFELATSPSIQAIQESLKQISRLEFLTVRQATSLYPWSSNPIRPALLQLLHLPTLTHFKATNLIDFVVSDLIPCINLKYLDIGFHLIETAKPTFPSALPEHSIQLNEFIAGIGTPTVVMKLCTAQRPDGRPIIDFGSLSKITVALEKPNEGEASQELLRRCHVLTDVDIYFWNPRNVRPSLADMLRPSMHTLKHIVVGILIDDDVDNDPLFGIPSELEDMRTKNIIETVTIEILVQTDADCRRGDDWGRLDEVLTAPGWFSLKRVSLAIEITRFSSSDDELVVALRNLPETQFPRLSSSDSVSFNFEVKSVLFYGTLTSPL